MIKATTSLALVSISALTALSGCSADEASYIDEASARPDPGEFRSYQPRQLTREERLRPLSDEVISIHGDAVDALQPAGDAPRSEGIGTLQQALSTNGWHMDNQWQYFSWGEAIDGVECPEEVDWYNLSINAWVAWWYGINDETFSGGRIQVHNNDILFPASQTRCAGGRHDVLMRYGNPRTGDGPCSGSNIVGCTRPYRSNGDIVDDLLSFEPGNKSVYQVIIDLPTITAFANNGGIPADVAELYFWCHEFGHSMGLDHTTDQSGPDFTCMVTNVSASYIATWYQNGRTTYYSDDEYEYVATNYDKGGAEGNCSGVCNPI